MNLSANEPFWVDEPWPKQNFNFGGQPSKRGRMNLWFKKVPLPFSTLTRFAVLIFFIYIALQIPLMWIFVILETILITVRVFSMYILPRKIEAKQNNALRIQQLAKERTGSDLLGSAVHIAGHPLLNVNQLVVLGLKDKQLSIYSYESPVPLDTISTLDLRSVDLVVFDDENVPHLGVIDNNARTMQLTFHRNNLEFTCSFRKFLKIRPIDWYHAIQKARLLGNAS